MKGEKILLLAIIFLFCYFVSIISAIGSSNYNITSYSISGGGHNTSSINYKTNFIINDIAGNVSSSSYKEYIGFFYSTATNTAPVVSNVILNSTSGNNLTSDNLTVYYTSSDDDGDLITNITDWRKDGISIAVLNMPFDTNEYSVSSGAVRDYSTYENNGTLGAGTQGYAPTWTSDGKIGGAYEFDGVDDRINSGNLFSNWTKGFTYSLWVKYSGVSTSQWPYILGPTDTHKYPGLRGGSGYGANPIYLEWGTNYPTCDGTSYTALSAPSETDGDWHYVVFTYNQSYAKVYFDGNYYNQIAEDSFCEGAPDFYIGYNYNGSIDEVKIYNYSLSAEKIAADYQAGLANHSVETIVSQETAKGDVWSVAVTPNDAIVDGTSVLSNSLTILNTAPNNPSPNLISVDSTNQTASNLNCSALITDNNTGDLLDISVMWIKNDALQFIIDYNNSYSNATMFSAILNSGNTTKTDNWKCGIRVYDGAEYSNWVNSSKLTILNTLPTVTLSSPADNNVTINRTPTFSWSGHDDDGDSLTYQFNLTCYPSCSVDNRFVNVSSSPYTVVSYLKYLKDNNYYYNWSVRASDDGNITFGDWSLIRKIEIQSYINIILINDTIQFGTLSMEGSVNTTTNNPYPFLLENNGNVQLNISVNATDLWNSAVNPSSYYKYKIDNKTGEEGSFNWPQSQINWKNVPDSTQEIAIVNFSWNDETDSAEIDVLATVPPGEGSGNRESTVNFEASLDE